MRSKHTVGYLVPRKPESYGVRPGWILIARERFHSYHIKQGDIECYRVWQQYRDSRPERLCVTLGKSHPYANSAGYQRLARFIIADSLGYLPDPMTHTHHVDGNSLNDAWENLELISAAYHGRIHASGICVGRGRDGRFIPLEAMGRDEQLEIAREVWLPRYGAVIGTQATR